MEPLLVNHYSEMVWMGGLELLARYYALVSEEEASSAFLISFHSLVLLEYLDRLVLLLLLAPDQHLLHSHATETNHTASLLLYGNTSMTHMSGRRTRG